MSKLKSHRPESDLATRRPSSQSTRPKRDEDDHERGADGGEAQVWARNDGHELPYRAELERSFGLPLGHIRVELGAEERLRELGAKAFTEGDRIVFAEQQPSLALVAHEVTHVVQNQKTGATPAPGVAPTESHAESEANQMASLAAQAPGAALPPVAAPPGKSVQLSPQEPVVKVDKTQDANQLLAAIDASDKKTIFAVLERNAKPENMYALAKLVPGLAGRLYYLLTPNEWARARASLGEQVQLDLALKTHDDKDAIFRDLQEVSDQRVLALFTEDARSPLFVPAPTQGAAQPPTHEPAPTSIGAVKNVLREKLQPADYGKAMKLLLDKADRALKLAMMTANVAPPGTNPNDFVLTATDVVMIDPANPNDPIMMIFDATEANPLSHERLDVVEEQIRNADAASNSGQAYLELASLNAAERKALAARIAKKPLVHTTDLAELALQTDDASMLQQAIMSAHYATSMNLKAAQGLDMDEALAKIGELVRKARLKLDTLPADASEAERKKATDEVTRLETMFFSDSKEATYVRGAVELTSHDPQQYAEKLRTMGADPVTVGTELLEEVADNDIDGIIAALKRMPPEARSEALIRSKRNEDVYFPTVPSDKREVVDSLLAQGRRSALVIVPGAAAPTSMAGAPSQAPIVLDPSQLPFDLGPSPEATIALHEILDAMSQGPNAASFVLTRLGRLSVPDHKSVCSDMRFLAKLTLLPADDIEQQDFKEFIKRAAVSPSEANRAIREYPNGPEYHPGNGVRLEEARLVSEDAGGQAAMRRAAVLDARIEQKQTTSDELTVADQQLLERYHYVQNIKGSVDESQRTMVDEIALGQPQLQDNKDGTVDANIEAEFMLVRLHKATNVPLGTSLAEWHHDRPGVTEALTQFQTLYDKARPAGIDKGELAMLAEIYYRAQHEIEAWNVALAENEGLAKLAATVAGVVVACVVTAATGGLAGPFVVGALAAISAGTASMLAGAAVRWEDTSGSMLTDFGSGAVEGIATVAGAGLASKIVRGASAGLSAGEAAAEAAGHAAKVGGSLASHVAESAIDGAFGGAAGELFQTAVDEATWDHGIGEGLAHMLAALARGAATGALAGGVMGGLIGGLGKLASKQGPEVAHGVGHLLDSASVPRKIIDDVSDHAREELGHAFTVLEAGDLEEAERMINSIEGIPAKARAMMIEAARARSAIRATGAIETIDLEGEVFWPRVVEDKQFSNLTGVSDKNTKAVMIVENRRPQIIARRGASPASIREEVIHLHQWHADIGMRQKMQHISESMDGFSHLKGPEKLNLHIEKLEVEADAQRRLIAQFEHEVAEDPEAAMRAMDAEENLFLINERLQKLKGVDPASLNAESKIEALGLDDAPHLYTKSAHSPSKIKGRRASAARKKFINKSIDDSHVLKELENPKSGYVVHRNSRTGEIFRITRHPDHAADLPHLTLEGRTIKEGSGVATFAERKQSSGVLWEQSQDELRGLSHQLQSDALPDDVRTEIQVKLQASGPKVREQLYAMVVQDQLDKESAGLISKWGAVAEELERQSDDFKLKQFFDYIKGLKTTSLTETENDGIRRFLRDKTLDYIEGLKGEDRFEALQKMLDIQPDPGSKGELFSSFRERMMMKDKNFSNVKTDGLGTFDGKGLKNPRTPDGAAQITGKGADLPQGNYAIEDKAGDGAFKLNQAQDYARRSYDSVSGFKLNPNDKTSAYDGVVYVFSQESEATAALAAMEKDKLVSGILGKQPGGIHVMYYNGDAKLVRMSDLSAPVPTKTTR